MAVYSFQCSGCGCTLSVSSPIEVGPVAPSFCACTTCPDGSQMLRDYRAEAVGIGTGVRISREPTDVTYRDFVPTPDDYKGPGDPEGVKGFGKWRDEHAPKTNKVHPDEKVLRKSW